MRFRKGIFADYRFSHLSFPPHRSRCILARNSLIVYHEEKIDGKPVYRPPLHSGNIRFFLRGGGGVCTQANRLAVKSLPHVENITEEYKLRIHLLYLLNYLVLNYKVFSFTHHIIAYAAGSFVKGQGKGARATGETASSLNSGHFFFGVFCTCGSWSKRHARTHVNRQNEEGARGEEDLLPLPLHHLFSRLPSAQRSLNTPKKKEKKKKNQEREREETTPPTQNVVSALFSSFTGS